MCRRWSCNLARPTNSVFAASTLVVVAYSLMWQHSRLVCQDSRVHRQLSASARSSNSTAWACIDVWVWSCILSWDYFSLSLSSEFRRCSFVVGASCQQCWHHHRVQCILGSETSSRHCSWDHGLCSCVLWSWKFLCRLPQPVGLSAH